jgi:gamma-glutamyltranspeptidase / glutathione hydrolase
MLFSSLCVLALLQSGNPQPVASTGGMVVSDKALASEVGAEILRKGGNAVDAAVAVGFALAVTQPSAGNIGGGGFMLVRMADGRAVFIDYREMAPGRAHRDMYLKPDGTPDPMASTYGLRAGGVPGTVAGMHEALSRYGTMRWRDVVEPSVRLARDGFPVSESFARSLRGARERLERFPESRRIFLRDGDFYRAGETFRQPELATTLDRIAREGWREFYFGKTASLIAGDMAKRGGLITKEDLANYRVQVREPLRGSYRGHEILTAPPPSSGGTALLQMLGMLEGMKPAPHLTAARYHQYAEAMKLAFADRSEYMGDPDFVDVPVAKLLAPEYIDRLRGQIDPGRARPAAEIRPGLEAAGREGTETTHYSVVDAAGNVVSNTYTINTGYGSADTVVGAGFIMNNEMDDFAAAPGKPNFFGLIQGERNAIAPRKRPLSSMTPTIVLREGRPLLAVGSPGGPTIINTVLLIVTGVIDHNLNIQAAVQAPRIHHQWMPDVLRYERGWVSPDTVAALVALGHRAEASGFQGAAQCIAIDPATGTRFGAADTRQGDAKAVGVDRAPRRR